VVDWWFGPRKGERKGEGDRRREGVGKGRE